MQQPGSASSGGLVKPGFEKRFRLKVIDESSLIDRLVVGGGHGLIQAGAATNNCPV